jgi:hypothetical protein
MADLADLHHAPRTAERCLCGSRDPLQDLVYRDQREGGIAASPRREGADVTAKPKSLAADQDVTVDQEDECVEFTSE